MIERCQREIAAIEAQILAGNPDLQGLCLALSDWSGAEAARKGEYFACLKEARASRHTSLRPLTAPRSRT